jgi:hypothetical protein
MWAPVSGCRGLLFVEARASRPLHWGGRTWHEYCIYFVVPRQQPDNFLLATQGKAPCRRRYPHIGRAVALALGRGLLRLRPPVVLSRASRLRSYFHLGNYSRQ